MNLWEIFRFEVSQQLRRISTWAYFAVLLGFTYQFATGFVYDARNGGYFLNAPFSIASMMILCGILGLLLGSSLAGDAGARDAQTRMHPLLYTTPISKAAYLRGRFLAAFILNLLISLAVPIGILTAMLLRTGDELMGPFRPAAYLSAYVFLALPNAFIATAFMFSLSVLSRKAVTSYLGSMLLLFLAIFNWQFTAGRWGWWTLAKLLDPFGLATMSAFSKAWTPAEKNTLLVGMQGTLLANRLLWLGIALSVLAFTHLRFRLAQPSSGSWWSRGGRRQPAGASAAPPEVKVAVPRPGRTFGFATRARQTLAIAWQSFRQVVMGWGGLALAILPTMIVLTGPELMEHLGVPLLPTTAQISAYLTGSQDIFWLLIPLLTVIFAGELVWRERDGGLSEIADAAPVPEWVSFMGKLMGLTCVLALLQGLLMAAGMLVQARMGYTLFEVGLYARIFFGLQLADCLLFALLALAVHTLVNQKYVGHMVLLVTYGVTVLASELGIEHKLLIYGAGPGWAYSDMRGFAPFLAPLAWFKLYWASWALLLAVTAKVFWVRGKETGLGARIQLAGRRFTRLTAGAAAVAVGLILAVGGFIFYNTNVLNAYHTVSDGMARRAEYERRYGQYKGSAQPQVTGASLRVEIHPRRRAVDIDGTFTLENRSAADIDSIHVATASEAETRAISFDRPARRAVADDELGYHIYALGEPLRPGDSLRLSFQVRYAPRGFSNNGIDASVVPNGTYFTGHEWLPAIGYQTDRELQNAGQREAYGLAARPELPPLDDARARRDVAGAERIAFAAVVGTDEDQVAVAPGRLRRTWTENGRRYFHYVADAPIRNDYAFFSAAYAVHEARWNGVSIQIFHHPEHAWNLERMVHGVRASLDYYTRQLGPYPQGQIRLVEHPGEDMTLHASPVNISYQEGFSLLDPVEGPRGLDLPFAVVAHEVAHQWWGNQLTPAPVEGAPVLTESLAWYSALEVVEKTYGPEHLYRLLRMMREVYLTPRARADVPLLRATNRFHAYRKGPLAMYALREYIGEERINTALRRLLRKHGSGEPPLPTSLDLHRELQAVTPASLRYLLTDLFEANTFWDLATERVTAQQAEAGGWQVTLDVRARKVAIDSTGAETEVPMNDLIEIGVFAAAKDGALGEPLYRRMHRVRSGEQRITMTVPGKPARAGIDPRRLLIDLEARDNLAEIP